MIVSFHPIIEAHKNIICAGRSPNVDDLAAIKHADAVILPQGCPEALYRMARRNCRQVFPNLDVRFDFPGKRGQIQLFRNHSVDYPRTRSFDSVAEYHKSHMEIPFPCVVKLDWGGQGETVFKVNSFEAMQEILVRIETFESTEQYGFLIQDFIPHRDRSLRVAVIGSLFKSYWRSQAADEAFGTSVANGASIDHKADPDLQMAAKNAAQRFCTQTGLQLAGLDYIFPVTNDKEVPVNPLILEINYFFGRTGLGGSGRYYEMLTDEVDKWLAALSLSR